MSAKGQYRTLSLIAENGRSPSVMAGASCECDVKGQTKTTQRHRSGLFVSRMDFRQPPTASLIHFLVKLSFAAPASFFSAADLSHAAFASVSHFFIKLVIAAPASFLFPASTLHDSA